MTRAPLRKGDLSKSGELSIANSLNRILALYSHVCLCVCCHKCDIPYRGEGGKGEEKDRTEEE